jgi:hypothetical protein
VFTRVRHSSRPGSRLYWTFRNRYIFTMGVVSPRPTPKLEGHPLSAVRDCLFNIFAATSQYLETVSPTRNLRTRHVDATCFYISNVCEQNTNYRYIVRKRLFNLRASEQSQLHKQKWGRNFFKRFVQMCLTDNRDAIIINSINLWRNKLQIVLPISKVTTKQCLSNRMTQT